MSDAVDVTRKCSHASPYALFLSLIILFSLPATTFASLNVSYSAPTQCNSFQIAWDDSHFLYNLFILPLDDRPVHLDPFSLLAPVHDTKTKTSNYTLDVLPLKSGTQFILAIPYASGALLLPCRDTRIKIAHNNSPNSCK